MIFTFCSLNLVTATAQGELANQWDALGFAFGGMLACWIFVCIKTFAGMARALMFAGGLLVTSGAILLVTQTTTLQVVAGFLGVGGLCFFTGLSWIIGMIFFIDLNTVEAQTKPDDKNKKP